MKQKLFLVVGVIGIAQLVSAAPVTCMSGSLQSYIALGAAGCSIGTDTVSGFQTFTGLTGSSPISPQNIIITPTGGATNPGITVQATGAATMGKILDTLIGYQISGNSITSDMVTVSNTSSSGNGVATDIQNYCLGGVFGPNGVTGCSGPNGNLLVLGNGSSQASFGGVKTLSVTHDFTLDSGGTGSASGGTIMDQFTAAASTAPVPEPATLVLTGLGLALAVSGKTRRGKDKEMIR